MLLFYSFAWPSRRSPQPLAPSPAWAYSRSDTARRVVPASQGVGPSPALLRQLQTVAGISMPLTSRPGMGIVGMASVNVDTIVKPVFKTDRFQLTHYPYEHSPLPSVLYQSAYVLVSCP